jgi:chorismate mutase
MRWRIDVVQPSTTNGTGMQPSPGPLIELVIRRLFLGDLVAAAKFGTGLPLTDPAREQEELDHIRRDATRRGIDPEGAVALFQDQMDASKLLQDGLFRRWAAHPEEAPMIRPELGQIRLQLDEVTTEIMQLLTITETVGSPARVPPARQADALVCEPALNRLDGLHRRALNVALRSST